LLSSHKRIICLLTALVLSASIVRAQQTPKDAPLPSEFDLFAGYSQWFPNVIIQGEHLSNSRQGVVASGTYYFNRTIGVELVGDYHLASGNTSMRSVSIGPVYRFPLPAHFTAYLHVLGGAAEIVGPEYPSYFGPSIAGDKIGPAWGPQLTFGGGIDWNAPFFHRRLSLRLLQADDLYEYFHLSPSVGSTNLNTFRISSGLVFRFGAINPAQPVTLSCVASPLNVLPGELLTVSGDPAHLNRHKRVVFHWTGPGVEAGDTSPAVTVDTAGLEPGTYRIGGQVVQGLHAGDSAHCVANFRVMPMKQSQPGP
jgi:hypothetical protein